MKQHTSSDKLIVNHIVDKMALMGVRHVVVSPGSRNAPLIVAFAGNKAFKCYSIIDERSASYYALGMARQLRQPVAMICTSGTAVLNYAPALAEAYYQEVPLIAITADRPSEWIDHEDGQTIRQNGIFSNYIKLSCSLPDESDADAVTHSASLLDGFADDFQKFPLGPAHINVPLDNPLYGQTEVDDSPLRDFCPTMPRCDTFDNVPAIWNDAEKIMVVVGINLPDKHLDNLLLQLAEQKNCVVVAPPTSNIDSCTVGTPESVIAWMPKEKEADFRPDLLITLGNAIISKELKMFLRRNKPQRHIDVDLNPMPVDTYRCLTDKIIADSHKFVEFLLNNCDAKTCAYRQLWSLAYADAQMRHSQYVANLPWCDFRAHNFIYEKLKQSAEKVILHISNSTPIRYAELYSKLPNADYYSNRGTSGIDGCLSTAGGASLATDNLTLAITGDVGFFYDSNCFYNRHLRKNFKIVLMNNGGGNIFSVLNYIKDTTCAEYFTTPLNFSAQGICQAFGVQHFKAGSADELDIQWQKFIEAEKCALLEIDTHSVDNAEMVRKYLGK